ncbi:Rv1733c family protein [Streptomyces violascens]|uniref:Rv1733c family protein n=1 Tax=Streptomyces violascens TaxID=67381 RepID=UPI003657E348
MGKASGTRTRVKVKRWRWRRNALRRQSDVVEAWTRLFLGSALLVGAPLTGSLIGLSTFDNAQAKADHQRATSHVVRATVAENVPLAPASTDGAASRSTFPATVRWTTPDGRTVTGTVKMPEGTRSGTPTMIWADAHDKVTTAPANSSAIWTQSAVIGSASAAGTGLVVGGVWLVVRYTARRRRMAEWERGWAATGPEWDLRDH